MTNILFCHGYATKYFILNGFTLTIAWGIARSPKSKKKIYKFICGYFFVTGNHNKTENEILSFRTLEKFGSEVYGF
jgi:hypothetical protein